MTVFLFYRFLNKLDFLLGILPLWQEISCTVVPFGFLVLILLSGACLGPASEDGNATKVLNI